MRMSFGWLARSRARSHIQLNRKDTPNANESHDQRSQGTGGIFSVSYASEWIHFSAFGFFFISLRFCSRSPFLSRIRSTMLCSSPFYVLFSLSSSIFFCLVWERDPTVYKLVYSTYSCIAEHSLRIWCCCHCCCSVFNSRYFISLQFFLSVHRIIFLLLLVIDVCSLETLI